MPTKHSDAQPLVDDENNCSRKRIKIRGCHAIAYGFLIVCGIHGKYEPRKCYYVIFTFHIMNMILSDYGTRYITRKVNLTKQENFLSLYLYTTNVFIGYIA